MFGGRSWTSRARRPVTIDPSSSQYNTRRSAMYAFLVHLHPAASLLSLAATLAWGWAAMSHSAGAGMTGRRKGLYVAAMATTGFAGLTGLAITVAGPWSQMVFPYVGLAAVAGHGMA